jgi:hypothetical protein
MIEHKQTMQKDKAIQLATMSCALSWRSPLTSLQATAEG